MGAVASVVCNPGEPCGYQDVCSDWESRLASIGSGSNFDCTGQLDLTISSITEGEEVVMYDVDYLGHDVYMVTFEVRITNLGDRSSTGTVADVMQGGTVDDTVTVPAIGPGEWVVVDLVATFEVDAYAAPPTFIVDFEVDPDGVLDDADGFNQTDTTRWTP
jgi:hypothetical protein